MEEAMKRLKQRPNDNDAIDAEVVGQSWSDLLLRGPVIVLVEKLHADLPGPSIRRQGIARY